MVLFTVIPAAEDKWKRLACETSTLLQDPEPRHVDGLPDLITYPLPQPGVELVRNFYHAKSNDVRECVRAEQGFPPARPNRAPVAVEIGPDGLAVGQHSFMILAILPNADGGNNVDLLISRYIMKSTTTVTLHPGDHIIIYECTQVIGDPGSRCILIWRDTEGKSKSGDTSTVGVV